MNALWDAVRERPDDDGVRAVLGDAMLREGDPQGELVAVQLRLASGADDDGLRAREAELVEQAKASLPIRGVRWVLLRRGLVEGLALDATHDLAELEGAPWLAGLRVLMLDDLLDPVARVVELARGPLRNLRSLHVYRGDLHGQAMALGELPLETLTLASCNLGDSDAAAIASHVDPRLEALTLLNNEVGQDGARRIAKAARLASLRKLDLGGNPLGARGGFAFARRFALPALVELFIGSCELGESVPALLRAMPKLERLDLRYNRVRETDLRVLVDDPTVMPALRTIYLNEPVAGLPEARPHLEVDA